MSLKSEMFSYLYKVIETFINYIVYRKKDLELIIQHDDLEAEVRRRLAIDGILSHTLS